MTGAVYPVILFISALEYSVRGENWYALRPYGHMCKNANLFPPSSLYLRNDSASYLVARVSRRLCCKIIGAVVNNNSFAEYLIHSKTIG